MEGERRLAAILSADVVGYSRLMAEDEEGTVRTLTAWREQIEALVRQLRGRIVDFTGDNFLAEFPTALDGARCAIAIQRVLRARNAELPEERKMRFRIGVHLGDVRVDGERIFGAGVNVAARLEQLAQPGGICMSAAVHEQVVRQVDESFQDLGERELKNIPDRVRVFRVQMDGEAVWRRRPGPLLLAGVGLIGAVLAFAAWSLRPTDAQAPPPAETPSLAVLPFTNLSEDPAQEYFADGMTEDLITDLSKISGLLVIARNSTFTYKGKAVSVGQVASDLGVRYVLEGSVRRSDERVRVNAQLIDAETEAHLWAERYDRELADIFAVQDELTHEIVKALRVTLSREERSRVERVPTRSLEAYDLVSRAGNPLLVSRESIARVRGLLEQAVEIDPGYADAWADLALTYWADWFFQLGVDSDAGPRALELASRAIGVDSSLPYPRAVLAMSYAFLGRGDDALVQARRAVALAPGDAFARGALGLVLNFGGHPEEALAEIDHAVRLDPIGARMFHLTRTAVLWQLDRVDEALEALEPVLAAAPGFLPAQVFRVVIHMERDKRAEARAAAREIRRISPDFSVDTYARDLPYADAKVTERIVRALRRAGLQ